MFLSLKEDKKAEYQELLLESMNSMYNLAYRLTMNKDDAADLVQEASLRGFRFFYQYESGTNFKGWILTIVRNLFINQYRKRVKEPNKVNYDDVQSFVSAPDLNGANEEIFGEHVQKAMDGLPEEMREVVTLFYVEGFSYKEIAEIVGCPLGTVMSRLHMAKQLLKKRIKLFAQREGGLI